MPAPMPTAPSRNPRRLRSSFSPLRSRSDPNMSRTLFLRLRQGGLVVKVGEFLFQARHFGLVIKHDVRTVRVQVVVVLVIILGGIELPEGRHLGHDFARKGL